MSTTARMSAGLAAATVLIGCGQLAPAPAVADPEQHNVTYIARIDGLVPDAVVTFMLRDNQTTSGDMPVGKPFQANTVLADPAKAGLQVRLRFPYSANVHCEIDVDGISAVKVDRFINTWANSNDPLSGVLQCGAPLTGMA